MGLQLLLPLHLGLVEAKFWACTGRISECLDRGYHLKRRGYRLERVKLCLANCLIIDLLLS